MRSGLSRADEQRRPSEAEQTGVEVLFRLPPCRQVQRPEPRSLGGCSPSPGVEHPLSDHLPLTELSTDDREVLQALVAEVLLSSEVIALPLRPQMVSTVVLAHDAHL